MTPDPCPTCGRYPLHHDPAAAHELLEAIHDETANRLLSVEAWTRGASADDRVAVARWIDRTLDRPPFAGRIGKDPVATLLAWVARDISLIAIDPASPMTPAGIVPEPHPLLAVPLPDDDAGTPQASPDEVRAALGGVFAREPG